MAIRGFINLLLLQAVYGTQYSIWVEKYIEKIVTNERDEKIYLEGKPDYLIGLIRNASK